MAPAQQPSQSPFHRFRLNDFQRVEPSSASNAAGQCSRFRVTDFVPWSESPATTPQPTAPTNGVSTKSALPANAASPSTVVGGAQRSGFLVMHMDVDSCAPQQTSTAVATAGSVGSGKGMLQVKQTGAPTNVLSQPAQLSPAAAGKTAAFDPAQFPEEIRWELARVLGVMRTLPAETVVTAISDRLLAWPSLEEGSLLRRMAEIFPSQPPPPPTLSQQSAAVPASPSTASAPLDTQQPVKRKRGRPKKDAPVPNVSAAPASATIDAAAPGGMAPPPGKVAIPALPFKFPNLPISASKKDKDTILTCTRCLKPFNPAWRPTPASDPSSEATCAVRHPYPDFASGLDVCPPGKRKNAYKTTWRWKCCGREVQSTADEPLQWPRKEDDRTGGWCFVGKHTTDPSVRDKMGLKPGKGKRITDEPLSKKPKADELPSSENGSEPPRPVQAQAYAQAVPMPSPRHEEPEETPEVPVKRKRGRPKGSKTKKTLELGVSSSPANTFNPPPQTSAQASPGTQLMAEASSSSEQPIEAVVNGDHGANFWAQYTDPYSTSPAHHHHHHHHHQGHDDEHMEGDGETDALGMSSVELGMLVNATATMGGRNPGSNGAGTGHIHPEHHHPSTVEDKPPKRGRGRPKGVKNGAGKTSKRKADPPPPPPPQQLQEPSPVSPVLVQDTHVNSGESATPAWGGWAQPQSDWYNA